MMLLQRESATTTVVLRSVETDPVGRRMLPPASKQRGRVSRLGRAAVILSVLAVALLGMVFSGGLPGTTTSPAQANPFSDLLGICQNPDDYKPAPEPWPGLIGGLALIGREGADSSTEPTGVIGFADGIAGILTPYTAQDSPTAYEWYGTAGLTWNVQNYEDLGADCGIGAIGAVAGNLISTIVFQFGLIIGEIGLTIYGWALNIDAITPFLNSIGEVLTGLRSALFLEYLIPIVMLGALWMMWVGLVKKRTSEAVQGAVWMVLASAATLFFLANPVWITENVNKVVTGISTTIVDGTLSATSGVADSNICQVGDGGDGLFSQSSWRTSQCQIWEVYMFSPWAAGTFGTVAGQNIDLPADTPPVQIIGKPDSWKLPLVYLDSQTFNKNEVLDIQGREAEVINDPENGLMVEKKEQWRAVYDSIYDGEAFAARSAFTGRDWDGRLGIAFVNIIAMFVGAVPILFLAFTLVLMQLGTVFLLLAAPLFLTLGIHPGFGRRIAISWVEMLLSLQIKRIGTAVLLALLLAVFQSVLRSTDSWIAQTMLIGAASLGMLVYRKRILDQLSRINLGGGGGNSLAQGAGQMGKRATGTATGAVTSGGAAAMTGGGGTGGRAGSFLVGAALGSMMGRGGNPMTAARMGAARGAAVGRRRTRKAQGGDTVDPNSVEGTVAAERAERGARTEEESQMDILSNSGRSVTDQADMWQEWSKKNRGRAVPMPVGNDALREELERRGVPMRERSSGVDPRVERMSDRIADAVNENTAQAERHADTVVDVTRDATREMDSATDAVRAEVPVRPEAAGGGSDAAAQALERARRSQAVRQRKAREARERGAQSGGNSDGSTSTPVRPIPRAPDSAAPRPPMIPDPDGQ